MTLFDVKAIFRAAGWFKDRNIDVSQYEEVLSKEGIVIHSKARQFFQEFGNLKFGYTTDYSISNPEAEEFKKERPNFGKNNLEVTPLYYYSGKWHSCFEKYEVDSYSNHVDEPIIHIMSIEPGSEYIWIGESGRFYCCADKQCIRLGCDFWQEMYNAFNGIYDKSIENVKMLE